jgi:hypothetical protein
MKRACWSCSTIPASQSPRSSIVRGRSDRHRCGDELTGAKFGAFFYNISARTAKRVLYTLSGAPREAVENSVIRGDGAVGPTFTCEGRSVRTTFSRIVVTARWQPHQGMPHGHLPSQFLAMPVISSSGEVIGGLFFVIQTWAFSPNAPSASSGRRGAGAIAIDNARLYQARNGSCGPQARGSRA